MKVKKKSLVGEGKSEKNKPFWKETLSPKAREVLLCPETKLSKRTENGLLWI